jgi:Tol biopolymer transport system component
MKGRNLLKTADGRWARSRTILFLKGYFSTASSFLLLAVLALAAGCSEENPSGPEGRTVPHQDRWGIYALSLETGDVELIYSSPMTIETIRLNPAGDRLAFAMGPEDGGNEQMEIYTLKVTGDSLRQLTENDSWDLLPCWSPDGSQIAFLSWRDSTLDIYIMTAGSGSGQRLLYDSGYHDSDIHWRGDRIVFTRNSQIWIMNDDGTEDRQVTDPPRAGQWGQANLPFGDYDPRLHPARDLIVFERLLDDASVHGNYDIFTIPAPPDSGAESRLTETGYSQGLASFSRSGEMIVYLVAAIGSQGRYDLYLMNLDGSGNTNITPDYFPAEFLCRFAVFSDDDARIFFIGEWWE